MGQDGEIPAGESLRKGKAQARCCGHSRGLVLCLPFHPAPNEVCAAPSLPSAWVKLPAIGISTGGERRAAAASCLPRSESKGRKNQNHDPLFRPYVYPDLKTKVVLRGVWTSW